MADKKKPSKEVNQAQQANKKKSAYAAYAAAGTREKNKRRNMETEARRQDRDAAKRPRREALRKIGSVNRLERRIEQAARRQRPTTAMGIALTKALAAAQAAVGAR